MPHQLDYERPPAPWWKIDVGSTAIIIINIMSGAGFWSAIFNVVAGTRSGLLLLLFALVCLVFGTLFGVLGVVYTMLFSDDHETPRIRVVLLGLSSLVAISPWLWAAVAVVMSALNS